MINFCVFEDSYYKELLPLTETRPACDLLVGITTIFNKIKYFYDYGNITIHCREYLKNSLSKHYPDHTINNINSGAPCFFINGRLILDNNLTTIFSQIKGKHNYLFTQNNQVIATFLRGDTLHEMIELLKSIPTSAEIINILRTKCICKEIDTATLLTNIWDIINVNPKIIENDFKHKNQFGIIKGNIKPFTSIYNENNVFINSNSTIEDFVLINAEKGPVYIDSNVYIESNTKIEGPVYIGNNSKIFGGKISASSIGKNCRIKGDVQNTIFQGYSNKAHEGFIGHSHVGKWVNLGAGTTFSNLKHNYNKIKIKANNNVITTTEQFLGSFIGDHVKTSINTSINAGTIIHFGSTLTQKNITEKDIPSFTWGNPEDSIKQDLNKFISTAKKVMKRRDIELTQNEIDLFSFLHQNSKKK